MPLISIIIPVYNHEEALQKALDSIVRQTEKNVEVIIVDDGSDVAVKCQMSNVNCQVLRQAHSGAPAARNRGFRESKGEYVIFWDADVIAEPGMLQKMKTTLDAHPEASYAYSDFYFGRKKPFGLAHGKMPAQTFDPEALKKNNYINTTSLIRRSAAIPWDESLKRFQDWDLWLTMLEQGKTGVWIPEYLFRAIPHKGGISTWLPSFAYRAPWNGLPFIRKRARRYEEAKEMVRKKHRLP